MKIKIKRSELHELATKAASVAEAKGSMPVLAQVVLAVDEDRLSVAATDLYTSARASAACAVDDAGRPVAVSAKQLSDVVGRLPDGEITVSVDKAKLRLASGRSRYHLPTTSPDDMPKIPDAPEGGVDVDPRVLSRIVDSAAVAMCGEETRPHMMCVLLEITGECMRTVATDGHRLHRIEVDKKGDAIEAPMSVPPKGVTLLRSLAKGDGVVVLATKGGNLFARQGDAVIAMRLVDDKFPPYDAVIPREAARKIGVKRVEMLDALKRVASVNTSVRISTTPEIILIEAENRENGGEGVEEVRADGVKGEAVGANARYMIDALSKCVDDDVELWLGGELDPVQVRAAGYTAVVMPQRL